MAFDEDLRRDDTAEAAGKAAAEEVTEAVEQTTEEATAEVTEAAEEATAEVTEAAEELAGDGEEAAEELAGDGEEAVAAPKKKKGVGGWIALAVVLVAAAVVAVLYFTWLNGGSLLPQQQEVTEETAETDDPTAIRITGVGSLTAEAEDVTEEVSSTVVAENKKLPEKNFLGWVQSVFSDGKTPEIGQLTNAQLAVYYWNAFYQFSNQYYMYADALGLDPAHMEDSQAGEDQTWQEFFLSAALSTFHTQNAVYRTALDEGMELPENYQNDYDTMTGELTAMDDIGEQLEMVYGPGVTLEDYLEYMKGNYYYTAYMEKLSNAVEYSEDDLRAFFDANPDRFSGLEQTDDAAVNVRHVLISPTDSEDEESWKSAEAHAQELYEKWKSEGATEDGFAELAGMESEDPGSRDNGGLYEGVIPGQMVPEFNDWCFDPARQPGDHGIVKTDYGYHIMYFVSAEDTPYWLTQVAEEYKLEKAHEASEEIASRYALEYSTDGIKLALAGQIRESETPDVDAG